MNTKDIEEVYNDILAAFGAEPIDKEAVIETLSTLTQHHKAEVQRAYERGVADGTQKPLLAIENVREAERERFWNMIHDIDKSSPEDLNKTTAYLDGYTDCIEEVKERLQALTPTKTDEK